MRALIQRVSQASVSWGEQVNSIGPGIVLLLAVAKDDTTADAEYLAKKTAELRIFPDKEGKMNISVSEKKFSVLAVSQFTLYGDCRKGRRPGFDKCASGELAEKLYEHFISILQDKYGIETRKGFFGKEMELKIFNQGPVTILLDS